MGHYAHIKDADGNDWFYGGGFDWTTVNWVYFFMDVAAASCAFWVDGFNFQGQIIRSAKDSTKIGADNERQLYIYDSVGKDDTGKAGTPGTTDVGHMARLAYAELLRTAKKPMFGTFQIPGAPDLLPGQLVHIHANKTNGSFNIDDDFRVTNVRHSFTAQGFTTQVSVTDDLYNSITPKTYSLANVLVNQLLGKDRESMNLKSQAVDLTTPILAETYTT